MITGGVSTIIGVFFVLRLLTGFIFGITPVVWRLGLGRWFRKIAIISNTEAYEVLRKDLVSSGLFHKKNIFIISDNHLNQVKENDLLLLDYRSFEEEEEIIKKIINFKEAKAGLIVYYRNYSPDKTEMIPGHMLKLIGKTENTTIVNFRGRLLNDIVTTLITTSYEKRKN
jgi:hypothetical protein